ncbi:MAG: Malonyl CoA-acyl carrier protein transacylase [Gemmatimonadetes bacterium]|nr:Malonyl CoA-acyl carrier protein transacylase [Gemmatimonadota bacterium]
MSAAGLESGPHTLPAEVEACGRVAEGWNGTGAQLPADVCIHQLFEAQAAATPDAEAVLDGDERLTYRALNERANRLAHHLRRLGVAPEARVAVCVERSAGMVVATLAVLKAGGAYVPMDPGYPAERLGFMLADCGAPVLLASGAPGELPPVPEGVRVVSLDDAWPALVGESGENPESGVGADNLGYVIYTSGSTGRPKGVMNAHRGVVNRLRWMQAEYGIAAGDVVLQKTPFSFDVSVWELFWPLQQGARLVMARPGGHRDPDYLQEVIERHGVTTLHFVPSMLGQFVETADAARCSSIQRVICSGEALPAELVRRFHARFPEPTSLHNLYGPTEAAVDVSHWACERGDPAGVVPIGGPVWNTTLYVLDGEMRPVVGGEPGELFIGGVQVARGYHGRPGLTAERFVPDPLAADGGARLYRTGDRARRRADGALEYLGRLDDQVKIRGFRIEPGEIQAVLGEHPGVQDVVVADYEHAPGDRRLAAYVVPHAERAQGPRRLLELEEAGALAGRRLDTLPDGTRVVSINRHETAFLYDEIVRRGAYLRQGVGLPDDACVFDVGANVGLFALRVSWLRPGSRVYAFEPIPEVCEVLRLNARVHGADVRVLECALGEAEGEAELTFYPQASILSGRFADHEHERAVMRAFAGAGAEAGGALDALVEERLAARPVACRVRTVSEVMRDEGVERIDLLKVDVEKSELEVLAGIEAADWPKIRQVAMEVHDEERLGRVRTLLEEQGFEVRVDEDPALAGTGLYDVYAVRPGSRAAESPEAGTGEEGTGQWRSAAALVRDLRRLARERLPEHMVPAVFVPLARLPLSPSGKVDRRALPAPPERPEEMETPFVAPRNETEARVAAAWAEVLGVREVGVLDDVFELGAHSLAVTQVGARLRSGLDVELPLGTLFGAATVEALAAAVERAPRRAQALVPAPRDGRLPLALGQERIWFLVQLAPENRSYNFQAAITFRGVLDCAALRGALTEIVRRHEIFRTTFPEAEGEPYQHVHPPFQVELPLVDLSAFSPGEREDEERRVVAAELARLFDLVRLPLVRWLLVRRAPDEHLLLHVEHHIVHDGWSFHVFLRELLALYGAFAGGRPSPLPELPVQFADYAAFQRRWLGGDEARAQLEFWRERLAGSPPVLELAFDRPRPPEQRFRGAAPRYELSAELYGRLRAASRRTGVTLFATMMAAFDVLLSRWSGQTDLKVGTGIANRRLAETQALMGMFVNNLVVRTSLDDDPPFAALARRVHAALVEAGDRQELPFDVVVEALRPERSLAWNPLFQVMFSFHDAPIPELRLPGLEVEVQPGISNGSAKFDLNVIAIPRAEQRVGQGGANGDDGITLVWEYNGDLFDAATMDTMVAQYRALLEAAASNAETPVSRLPAAGPSERRRAVPALRLHPSTGAPAGMASSLSETASSPPAEASSPIETETPPPATAPSSAGATEARAGLLSFAAPAGAAGDRDDAAVREVIVRQLDVLREHAAVMRAQAEAMRADAALMQAHLTLLGGTSTARVKLPHPTGADGAGSILPGDTIHRLFEAQAARTPDAGALAWEGGTLTYAELNARANRLAHHLAALGVGLETRVAVCTERGPELIAAILAVLKAGGAYLPLDPAYPAARLGAMLGDADARVLLTHEAVRPRLLTLPAVRVVSVDGADAEVLAARNTANPAAAAGPGTLAYVMFTSGSTGTPKGVAVEHRGVVRLVRGATYAALGPDEVILQAAPAWFDASTFEIWGALLNGGRLALAPPHPFGLVELGRALARHRVTTLWLTAGLFRAMVDERLEELGGLRQLLAGGDVLPEGQVRRVRERFPTLRLVNGYGPTENTTFTCCYPVGEEWRGGPVPVGRPIGGTRVHVLDAALRPVPAGTEGELFAGGQGVARGYLDRPASTAERFVPDPFASEPGARLYRTGDRVRARADGTVEYLGRLDAQVKIRGFRVEPGEVEAVLRSVPGVRDCAVAAREDRPGEKRLVAWVAGQAGTDEIRAHLARLLPEHMLPSALVRVDALPLNANGKLDRAALPAPQAAPGDAEHVAPLTPAEARVAEIWAALLGVQRVGTDDSFFALGGNSLLGMRMVSRVREAFGVELPLRALFDAPTVAELARRVEDQRAGDAAAVAVEPGGRAEGPLRYPASFAQERLWFMDRLSPGGSVYNISRALRLAGPLDAPALERALGEVVRRHAPLRATLREEKDGIVQVAAPFAGFTLPVGDLSALPAATREEEALRRAGEHAVRPFDLAEGPLFRAALLRLGGDEHVMLLTMHHAVSDGWSLEVLFRELGTLYAAFCAGQPSPLPPLPLQYGEHAARERERLGGAVLARDLAWWRERLAAAPPLLELPADHPRPAVQSFRGAREPVVLSARAVRAARALARAEGTTLFQVLLAAFQVLLSRYAGTADLVLGTPVAGRTQADTEGLVGFFANTLPLRADLSGDPGFREVLRRTRETLVGAWEHQDTPFEKVVEAVQPARGPDHAPLFQVSFALAEGAAAPPVLEGVRAEWMEVDRPTARWDLEVALAEHGEDVRGYAAYATDLFEPATVRRMMDHLARVVEQCVAESDVRVSRVDLLGDDERRAVLDLAADVDVPVPAGACIHHLFEAQAARTPNAEALLWEREAVTYAELNRRANRLAHHLAARGVGPEARVGVCLERGPELVAALLAVLKAGGAYVALDPSSPPERLVAMLRGAGARLLVTQQTLRGLVSAPDAAVVCVDGADRARVAAAADDDPVVAVTPRNLAYLVHTSGGTGGAPRGVGVEHASAVALLAWGAGVWSAAELAGSLASTSICSHVSVAELFVPLTAGGCVILARDVLELPRLAAADRVRTVSTLPSAAAALLEGGEIPVGVTTVNLSGEALRAELVDALHARGVARVLDLYGSSEAPTYGTWADRAAGGVETIGRPVAGTRAYVLDEAQGLLSPGVPGELYLGGRGLARGYPGNAALTAARFVPDPFAGVPGARMYRTGDRVCWVGGTLRYRGRLDEQVKVAGGFRVEPGEVEAALRRVAGVRDCVVVPGEGPGGTRLVAYLVGGGGVEGVRAALRRTLPEHMLPGAFVRVDALPRNRDGKVDRGALVPPPPDEGDGYQPPLSATEAQLAGIWAGLLEMERVGVHDDFFALGGHSLLGARVMSRVLDEMGVELPLRDLFDHPTVAALAERVDARRGPAAEARHDEAGGAGGGPFPLSFAQERLWFLERLQPGSAFYNVPWALRLRGELDAPALERALSELVLRHAALRTALPEVGGAPAQVVAPFAGLTLAAEEVAGGDWAAREAELGRRMAAEAQRPFDLAAGPLLRARLLRVDARDHVLLVCMHHAVTDGWSLRVMRADLAELYGAFREGRAPALPPLAVRYADHAAWQRDRLSGALLERELAFWRARLAGAPALLELPTDHPRPAVQSFRGATERIPLPPALLRRLREVGRGERASAFMVLLAAFELLLARYAGTTDVLVGTLVAGRTRKELEALAGFFVNTVVLRGDLAGDPPFREALRRVRASTLAAFEHQEIPFEKVVEAVQPERSLGHAPLFQVAFRVSQGGKEPSLPGLATETLEVDLPVTKFDLSATFALGPDRFELALEYATDLFERSTILRMAGHLRRVLEQVAGNPDVPLSRLELMDPAERRRVLEEWNPPAAPAVDACVHHLFGAQAARTPHAAAVLFHGQRVSYAELDARANRLAHHLRALGVGAETCVGVCLERNPDLIAALLAVLKAGGAYVPLDPAYPRERLEWMAQDAGVRLVLTSTVLAPRLPGGTEPVCVDALAGELAPLPEGAPEDGAAPENLSHVIFTSGSTGRPKGVMIRHAATVARLRWLREEMSDDERAGVLASTSVSFDVSVAEIFGTLCWGGTLVLVENALELPRAAAEAPVRSAFMVPSAAAELLRSDGIPAALRTLNLAGEALPADLARGLHARGTALRVRNLYGPTEDTTYSTASRVEPAAARVRIGRPLPGGRAYVLDAALAPVPAGVPGELYLGGVGLARGYAARPDLTAERFLPDPFGLAGSRMYRTMDRARWTADGELEYLGRTDFQVKVRGFRIELGEIETALRAHPRVRDAVAVVRDEAGGGRRIVAYATGGVPAEALRAHLRERLPEYMIPAAFVAVDRLPLTPNGKVDRGALPPPAEAAPAHRLEPETEMESRVAALWSELLELPAVGVEESFFDLGGHSLLMARMQTRLARDLGSGLSLVELFQYPTVRAIAARLQGADAPAGAELGVERGTERQAGLARLGGRKRR